MTAPTIDALLRELVPAEEPTGAEGVPAAELEQLVFGDEVEVAPIDWLWYGRVAFKKLCGLIGMPDVGKDTLSGDLAARLSKGAPMPDGRPSTLGDPRPTLYLSGEDAFKDTLLPRFLAAGGDRRYLAHYPVVFKRNDRYVALALDDHLALIQAIMAEAQRRTASGPGLLVLSPFEAFLSAKVDAWKSADIRRVLAPLLPVLEATGWALLAIAHFNKGKGQAALHRIANSQAFAAALRVAYLAGVDPATPERRVLIPLKRNLLPPTITGLVYRLTKVPTPDLPNPTEWDTVPKVEWLPDPCSLTADEVLAGPEPLTADQRAKAWLYEHVPSGREHAVLVATLEKQAKAEGRSWKAIRTVASELGIKSEQPKDPRTGKLGPAVWWSDL